MKNWGKFFILILILTIFTACGQKGASGGVPNPNIPKDEVLAGYIYTNASESLNMYDSSSVYNKKSLLSSIYINLLEIADNYTRGDKAISYIEEIYLNVERNKEEFFGANNWLGYHQINSTLGMLKSYDRQTTDAVVTNSINIFEAQKNSIMSNLIRNRYYVELRESRQINSFLNSTITVNSQTYTYYNYLENLGLLDNSSIAEKYARLSILLQRDINILNGKNVNYGLSTINLIDDKYHVTDMFEKNEKDDLINSLMKLKIMYDNYSNYTQTEITKQEGETRGIDNNTFNKLASRTTNMTYYLVQYKDGGNRLQLAPVQNTVPNGNSLITELNRIYHTLIQQTNPPVNSDQLKELYKLNRNIENYIRIIEEDYYMYTPNNVFSKTVISMQLYQLLKDEKNISIDFYLNLGI